MKTLSIDIETYSSVDLAKCGVYKYTEATDFDILLFGYSADGSPVQVVDLASGETIPPEVIAALTNDDVTKWAFNAQFERICLSRWLRDHGSFDNAYYSIPEDTVGNYLNPASWRCTMIWSAYMGLPLSLEGVGAVLGLGKQKLTEGKELIKYFCQPCAPTKTNGGRTRNLPENAPDKWAAFKRYNIRDVEVEMSIQEKLAKFPVLEMVWEQYHLDQEINDRGVVLDMELVHQAIAMDTRSRAELTAAMKKLTALDNPNSVQQMKQWLSDNGLEVDSLGKKEVAEMLKTALAELQKVLLLRQQLAKSSIKKYQAMEKAVCADGHARGMFQFYGANRTGRWAGRIIQMQNLPQNHLLDLAEARGLVRCGDLDGVELLYEDVPDTLLQLIRTAFVPKPGYKFIVSDFSAIEARVLAWFAGKIWRQEVFEKGGDIYCASASQMFKVPVEKHGVNGHLRQKGKIAELALGYAGAQKRQRDHPDYFRAFLVEGHCEPHGHADIVAEDDTAECNGIHQVVHRHFCGFVLQQVYADRQYFKQDRHCTDHGDQFRSDHKRIHLCRQLHDNKEPHGQRSAVRTGLLNPQSYTGNSDCEERSVNFQLYRFLQRFIRIQFNCVCHHSRKDRQVRQCDGHALGHGLPRLHRRNFTDGDGHSVHQAENFLDNAPANQRYRSGNAAQIQWLYFC